MEAVQDAHCFPMKRQLVHDLCDDGVRDHSVFITSCFGEYLVDVGSYRWNEQRDPEHSMDLEPEGASHPL
jgi:hypothetical protein